MLHGADDRALQPDQVAGQHVVENLPASVLQRLVAEGPAAQQREQLRRMRALRQDHGARLGNQLAALEIGDEFELFRAEGPELGHGPEGALLTGNPAGRYGQDYAHEVATLRLSPVSVANARRCAAVAR